MSAGKLLGMSAAGQYYGPPPYYPPPPRRGPGMATAGGALIITAGVLGIISAASVFWMGSIIGSYDLYDSGGEDAFYTILYVCGAILIIFSVIAILGGFMAVTKRSWGLGILGGIFALLCMGPLFIGSLLGLIGLILVAVSRDDFEKQQAPQMAYYYPPAPMAPPPMAGAPPPATRFCIACGSQIAAEVKFCPHCGKAGP